MRVPGDRDERARMQHLGAVVRDLRGLAMMELRDQASVGDKTRIGRQNAWHVLPEHGGRGAEGTREKRRRQVRAATSEGRHAAVRRLSDEAGNDRRLASGEERLERPSCAACRALEVRGGAAVMAVGFDDIAGVDERRLATGFGHGRGEDRGRHALAARDEHVARARFEMTEHANRDRQFLVFTRGRIDERQELPAARGVRDQIVRNGTVTLQELRGRMRRGFGMSGGGASSRRRAADR